jgi:hypothetical protein
MEANQEEAAARARLQRAQFGAAGVETTKGGTVQAVQETDLLATLEENERIASIATLQATNLRRAGSAARSSGEIGAIGGLVTSGVNFGSLLGSG